MTDLGVVDSIAVPAPLAEVSARFRRLPVIAQVFVVVAIVDAIVRTIGLIEPRIVLAPDPVGLFFEYGPRAAIILLPAIVLIRRPTAAEDTPWVLRGAVFLALVELVLAQTLAILIVAIPAATDDPASQFLFGALLPLIHGAAYLVLGIGLAALNPKRPTPVTAGLANLAALGVVAGSIAYVIDAIVRAARIDAAGSFTPLWVSGLAAASGLGLAYLVRALIRGLDDPSRLEAATRVAAMAGLMWGLANVVTAILGTATTVTRQLYPQDLAVGFTYVEAAAPLVLAVAFWLGLADPIRPLPKDWEAAAAHA